MECKITAEDIIKSLGLEKNDIDCYRATVNGCIVYLKNGDQISTKLSFSEIDSIFNCY